MPKGIPLTEEEIDRRRHEIFRAILPVIQTQGFHETSMREISQAAGIGKSTLYDYFRSKDEVLSFAIEEEIEIVFNKATEIAAQSRPAVEKIRSIMMFELEHILAKKEFYMQLMLEAQKLGLPSQKRIAQMRYAYQDLIKGIIEFGIHEGSFRKVNSLLAARMLINTMSNVIYTTRPTGSPAEMLDEVLDLFFRGVIASQTGTQ